MTRHELRDYDDTAGLIAALDAVVTVDTSVAHLAASMGKPTYLLLTDFEDWRWGTQSTTPWYPTMRIYRGDRATSVRHIINGLMAEQMTARADAPVPAVTLASLGAVMPARPTVMPLYMSGMDLAALQALVRRFAAPRVLEIGVNEGRTARFLLDTLTQIDRYVGIDVLPGYEFERTDQASEVPLQPAVYAKADSRFELVLRARGSFDVATHELGTFDVVFIDGDHGREAVLHDTQLAMSVLRPGGLIVWHDYGNRTTPDVAGVLDDLVANGRSIKRVAGSWIALEDSGTQLGLKSAVAR